MTKMTVPSTQSLLSEGLIGGGSDAASPNAASSSAPPVRTNAEGQKHTGRAPRAGEAQRNRSLIVRQPQKMHRFCPFGRSNLAGPRSLKP